MPRQADKTTPAGGEPAKDNRQTTSMTQPSIKIDKDVIMKYKTIILSFVLIFSVFTMTSCVQDEKKETDNIFLKSSTYMENDVSIKMECRKECDPDNIEIKCAYGHLYDRISFPSLGPEYVFDRVIFFYSVCSLNEFRELAEKLYDGSRAYLTATNYRAYFNEYFSMCYIIKDIPKETYLSSEYNVKSSGFLTKKIIEYSHEEIVKVPQANLLPETGIIRVSLCPVFYSEGNNNYLIGEERLAGNLKYTLDKEKIQFSLVYINRTNDKITYYNEDEEVLNGNTLEKE